MRQFYVTESAVFFNRLFENPPIAGLRHPPCARRIGSAIAVQNDLRNLGSVRAFRTRVEQAQIGHKMLFVVDGCVGVGRGFVLDIGIEFRSDTRGPVSLFAGMVSAVRPRKPSLSPW